MPGAASGYSLHSQVRASLQIGKLHISIKKLSSEAQNWLMQIHRLPAQLGIREGMKARPVALMAEKWWSCFRKHLSSTSFFNQYCLCMNLHLWKRKQQRPHRAGSVMYKVHKPARQLLRSSCFHPCNPWFRTAQGAFSRIRKSRVFQPGKSEFATFPSIFIASLSEEDAATWLCCSSVWA